MNFMKVLCVEDRPEDLTILERLLTEAGYEVIPAASGEEALNLVAQQPIDGVLLESDLPDATGVRLRREMKRIRPELPVLLFSGVGEHTPILIRFFDAYLRDPHSWEDEPEGEAG